MKTINHKDGNPNHNEISNLEVKEIPPMPSEEVQRQYWIDKEKQENATPKRGIDYNVYPPSATSDRKGWAVTIAGEYCKLAPFKTRSDAELYAQSEVIKKRALRNATNESVNDALSRTEATTDYFDHYHRDEDRGDLRDDGRSGGYGESYGERQ